MKLIKKIMMAATACGAVLLISGCGELKPDAMNGIYKKDDTTIVCKYDTDLELPNKDKYYRYLFHGNGEHYVSQGEEQFYGRPKAVDVKNGTIYDIGMITGQKEKIGEFKDGKITITNGSRHYAEGIYEKVADLPQGKTVDEIENNLSN